MPEIVYLIEERLTQSEIEPGSEVLTTVPGSITMEGRPVAVYREREKAEAEALRLVREDYQLQTSLAGYDRTVLEPTTGVQEWQGNRLFDARHTVVKQEDGPVTGPKRSVLHHLRLRVFRMEVL